MVAMPWQWRQSITRPIRAFQLNYVPVKEGKNSPSSGDMPKSVIPQT